MDTSVSNGQPWLRGCTYPGGNDGDPLAVPGVYHDTESEPAVTSFTLEVDGELFALRPAKQAVLTTPG